MIERLVSWLLWGALAFQRGPEREGLAQLAREVGSL